MLATFASLAGSVSQAQPAEQPGQYVLEPQRSSVTFAVDAFSHSQIKMRFHRMNAQLEPAHGDLDSGRVTVTIDAASLETRPRFPSPIIRGGGSDSMWRAIRRYALSAPAWSEPGKAMGGFWAI
ncbi:YceI family protein [Cupriavidus basilensis]